MEKFLNLYSDAALTSLGLFWMAFWAFGLGYLISSMIQVFVTRERMKRSMGETGSKSVALGTLFGFISSSCSFAALSTTRSLFAKGAGLVPALSFLLASTNLVIELGIIIAVFLSWQFVVGEYLGGVMLILIVWLFVRLTKPSKLTKEARERARDLTGESDKEDVPDWKKLMFSKEGWAKVANRYVMEWRMVWKDVTIGFTVAGAIAAFVPQSFFTFLFMGAGNPEPGFLEVLQQSLIGPIAAFFTFIGSMGNIPLAAVLYGNGVAFAGIMAFIFSDLVVFPVLRIQAQYYGWKMAFYIMGAFLLALVATSLILHYGFAFLDLLPSQEDVRQVVNREFFKVDYTLFFNLAFILLSVAFIAWKARAFGFMKGHGEGRLSEKILLFCARVAGLWLLGGILVKLTLL